MNTLDGHEVFVQCLLFSEFCLPD